MTRIYHFELDPSADLIFTNDEKPLLTIHLPSGVTSVRMFPLYRFEKKCIRCEMAGGSAMLLQSKGKSGKTVFNFLSVYLKRQRKEHLEELKQVLNDFSTAMDEWFEKNAPVDNEE